jgi:hypothetical protein
VCTSETAQFGEEAVVTWLGVSFSSRFSGRAKGSGQKVPVEVQPVDKRGEALGSGGVIGVAAMVAGLDEAGIAEDGEVLGDGGLGDAGVGGEVADGERTVAGQALEEGSAGGVGEGVEGGGWWRGAHLAAGISYNRMAMYYI